MIEYHKIDTVFKRDPLNNNKTLIPGEYTHPEFEYLEDNDWVFTEKVDGTNIQIQYTGLTGMITFGGKTATAQIPATLVNRLNDMFLPQEPVFAKEFTDGVCLYGEGYGPKINKIGHKYRDDMGFVLFDVRIGDWWLRRSDVEDVAKKLGLDVVPDIGTGTLSDMVQMTRNGFYSRWGRFLAEGIVARPAIELKRRDGQRIITKIKHKDFFQQNPRQRDESWPASFATPKKGEQVSNETPSD